MKNDDLLSDDRQENDTNKGFVDLPLFDNTFDAITMIAR